MLKREEKEPSCIRIGVDSLDEQRGYVDVDIEYLAEEISCLNPKVLEIFLNNLGDCIVDKMGYVGAYLKNYTYG